ncbi:MAG: MgtC/SapB family protein [Bacteroidota bacterium]
MEYQIIGKVTLAFLLGGLIGIEREFADKPAGLRTHMLVSGASALFVILGQVVVLHYSDSFFSEYIRTDPIRVIEAIVTGISFLGAGTIIFRREGSQVEGLTTAASILMVAALGICVGLGQLLLGVGLTVLTLVVLTGLGYLERWIKRKRK